MEAFLPALFLSLKVTLLATIIAGTLALLAAWKMARANFRGKSLIDSLLLIPLVLPPTVIGLALIFLCGAANPFSKTYETLFGEPLLFSWQVAVIAASIVAFPLAYRTFCAAFEQINPSVLDSARLLGASPWRVFRRIALPLAKSGILAGIVLAFARALGEFGATLMVSGNIPGKTQTIPLAIYAATESGALNDAAVLSLGAFGLNLLLLVVSNYAAHRPNKAKSIPEPDTEWSLVPKVEAVTKEPVSIEFAVEKKFGSYALSVNYQSKGRVLGVLGSSGAGKSLLLKCLSGLDTADKGYLKIGGAEIFRGSHSAAVPMGHRRIAHMLQDYGLFPHMTAWENIAFAIQSLPQVQVATAEGIARKIIAELGLNHLLDRFPPQLSGGQQQRVAIARALVMAPDVVLLDEPLSALDSHLRFRAEATLKSAIKNHCGNAIIVTHNIEEAYRLSDDLLILDDGQVIAQGDKQAVFQNPKTVRGAELTGCKNIFALPHTVDGFMDTLRQALVQAGRKLDGVSHIGIRANDITLVAKAADRGDDLTFPVDIETIIHSPFRVSIAVRIVSPDPARPLLMVETSRRNWQEGNLVTKAYVEIPRKALMPLAAQSFGV